MDVGKILLTPSDIALTIPGNNAAIVRPTPPTGFADKTASDSPQRVPSELENRNRQRNDDKVKHLIEDLAGGSSELSIAVDPKTHKIIVKVLNSETHEVIRQIPTDEALRLAQTLKQASGVLVDEVA